ncbi:hypothetical protein OC846_000870 [Tilletia horrida]|uniref:cellulase n=1 Tax=Tilletia horrida TaxID=155126 RepID=A0AAN6GV55_9BASI|nr:hypothetical protein OC845_001175 [Tilletia horrida]KAK0556843.1 hypothetical protein OC846_000870 [Tilletia horrida]KAK0569221.1 hypothetical protein OC861_001147 [Tilletia horrida]
MRLFVLVSTGLALLSNLPSAAAQIPITSVYEPPPSSFGRNSSADQWEYLLGNSLFYYDAQRSGVLPPDFRVSWRNNSVLNDGKDVGLNLSAGFFDAGNFIKATLPLSWAMTEIAWTAACYGSAFESASQTAYLDEVLRNGLDWLLEATSINNTVVVQVGTNEDNYWGGDQNIPTDRPSYVVTAQKPGTDVVASTAAALAAASMLYSGTTLPISPSRRGSVPSSLKDTTYSQTLLSRAQALFQFAQTANPQQVAQRVDSVLSDSYPSSDWHDKLAFAGAMIALATGDGNVANQTLAVYSTLQMPQIGTALNWDGRAPAVPIVLLQAAAQHPALNLNTTRFQSDAEAWFDSFADGSPSKGSGMSFTPGGMVMFSGYSSTSSLNPALNAAVAALLYAGFSTTDSKKATYRSFAMSQIDYMLGNNPMNAVYVVGQSPNSIENPHSALASGGTNINNIDNSPPVEAHVLYGALVGGPNAQDQYYDIRSDYIQSEPALDIQAPLVALTAYQITNSSSGQPFYVTLTAPRIQPVPGGSGGGIPQGGKIAIAVVVLVAVFSLAGGIAYWKRDDLRYWFRHTRMKI